LPFLVTLEGPGANYLSVPHTELKVFYLHTDYKPIRKAVRIIQYMRVQGKLKSEKALPPRHVCKLFAN
ncbi:MAG: hypothetical protein J6P87_03515, partial [Lachnospiraceae bacterium]|nr:hypothetical protein [Lachnospiraceae bacterium]